MAGPPLSVPLFMDAFTLMRSFRRIVELGGLAKAAEDLGVSPAGLSKQLRTLEAHLGAVLIQRTTRRMSLTETGQAYFRECVRLLDELDALEASVRQQSQQVGGRLRVNAPVSFALSTLSPLVAEFLLRYPALSLDLTLEDRLLDAVGEGFDVSIRLRAQLQDSSLIARQLGSVRQMLCAAPSYLARHPPLASPDELQRHSLLHYSLAEPPGLWPLHGPQGPVSVQWPARATVGNSLVLRDLLVAGLGIGALPSFLAAPALASGALVEVLPEYRFAPRQVFAVYPTSRHLQPKVRAFVDFLAERLPAALAAHS